MPRGADGGTAVASRLGVRALYLHWAAARERHHGPAVRRKPMAPTEALRCQAVEEQCLNGNFDSLSQCRRSSLDWKSRCCNRCTDLISCLASQNCRALSSAVRFE